MLDLNPETVYFIINKAHEFQVKEETALPEDSSVPEDLSAETLPAPADDTVFAELKATIEDLEPDQQVSLVSLMWLGRGDYTLDEWERALKHAGESWNARTAEYLIGTPLLADYLTEGLDQFGYTEE